MVHSNNNRRIFRNALFLYFRLILTLVVTLYTSRIVLNSLGIEDFGIYNVVAGIVTMMAFLSWAMSSATQRFFSFEIGKNNKLQLNNVFKMSVNIHFIIILIVVIFLETLGLWFVNNYLVIPIDRLDAANWIFQYAIFSFCCSIMTVPYSAAIIANEKMSAFAYISIVDVFLKLGMVFLLNLSWADRLETYGLLMSLVSFFNLICYYAYSRYHFSMTKFQLFWDVNLFKTLFSYTGWNLFGNLAAVMANQGVNILLNLFFGATVNAARAIASQVNSAVIGFVSSLQMSINPQIIKSYAANDKEYMLKLVFSGARYSFFLLYILTLPILFQTEFVLEKWLINVPHNTAIFCKLMLVDALITCLSGTLMTAAQASGKIRLYQIIVGGVLLLNLPLSYVLLSNGEPPYMVTIVSILMSILALIFRLMLLKKIINLNISSFIVNVLIKVMLVIFCTLPPLLLIDSLSANEGLNFIYTSGVVFMISVSGIYFVGLTMAERKYVKNKVKMYLTF